MKEEMTVQRNLWGETQAGGSDPYPQTIPWDSQVRTQGENILNSQLLQEPYGEHKRGMTEKWKDLELGCSDQG